MKLFKNHLSVFKSVESYEIRMKLNFKDEFFQFALKKLSIFE